MKTAIIGASGMIGSNLNQQIQKKKWEVDLYTKSNISEIKNKKYDILYIAAVSAAKWIANKDPEADKQKIEKLFFQLNAGQYAERQIFISTVDVYDPPEGDENTVLAEPAHAYGANRRYAEKLFQLNFENGQIIRLQGIVSNNLKKNILFDLKHNNMIDSINVKSIFQFYPITRLLEDVSICINNNLQLVNLSCAPMEVKVILEDFIKPGKIDISKVGGSPSPLAKYNVKSIYSEVFGGDGGYCVGYDEISRAITEYLNQ